MAILQDQSKILAELEALRQENARLKAARQRAPSVSLKVSAKGAVSAYGLGRFPVTLYQSQWVKLLDQKEAILEFIEDNADDLRSKDDPTD